MRIEKPTFQELMAIDIGKHFAKYQYHSNSGNEFIDQQVRDNGPHMPAGIEHYRLLAWLSEKFNNTTLVEIGSQTGLGLTSMAYNPSNRVISYDLVDHNPKHRTPENCERRICEYNFNHYDVIKESQFIFYDGRHHGDQEKVFLDALVTMNWKGILVLDDIHLNGNMEEFWNNIALPKEDWTDVGHGFGGAGTGVVFFE